MLTSYGGAPLNITYSWIASIALKVGSVLLGFVLSVILARSLGPEGYGIYVYVFAIVSLIAVPAQLGLPLLLVRETAKAQVNSDWGLMLGLWHWATFTVAASSTLLAAFALIIGILVFERINPTNVTTYIFGLALVPLIAMANLRGAALRGLRHIIMGQLPEAILRPAFLIMMLIFFTLYSSSSALSAKHAMGYHVVAAALSFIIGALMLRKVRPVELLGVVKAEYTSRIWLTATWPFALVAGIQLINQTTDIIMLGLFRSADEVGIYKVAVTGSSLVIFGLQAINTVVSPHFSRLYSKGHIDELQRLVTLSTRVIFFLSLPIMLLFVMFGDVIILHAFGKSYVASYQPLLILAGGMVFAAFTSTSGLLLMMTGHERQTYRAVIISAVINLVMNAALIPKFGVVGAGLATALSLIVSQIFLQRSVQRHLGIESMAFRISFISGLRK